MRLSKTAPADPGRADRSQASSSALRPSQSPLKIRRCTRRAALCVIALFAAASAGPTAFAKTRAAPPASPFSASRLRLGARGIAGQRGRWTGVAGDERGAGSAFLRRQRRSRALPAAVGSGRLGRPGGFAAAVSGRQARGDRRGVAAGRDSGMSSFGSHLLRRDDDADDAENARRRAEPDDETFAAAPLRDGPGGAGGGAGNV